MTIKVTQRHINSGFRRSACGCPVARAIADYIAVQFASIDDSGSVVLVLRTEERRLTSQLPAEALDFVRRYDRGETPSPFEFEFDLPL